MYISRQTNKLADKLINSQTKSSSKRIVARCNPIWSRIKTWAVLTEWKLLDNPLCYIKHSHIPASICYSWVHLQLPIVICEVDAITSARDSACRNAPGISVTQKSSTIFQVCLLPILLRIQCTKVELVDQKRYSFVPHLRRSMKSVTKNRDKILL